ncbi:lysophospholipid acyltransferase family protein [Paenibacillus provencensis]|uniref:Lysophospholipid acyltransferase family protein n=1 Tax=Paenibacillus provencensis TaxID=441151 RepID=A0ABW3PRP3_9BACL|nr:lysophospholipid acyltransferase family protein [Paenibacillus sp. MER 78]MCM3126539.1 1-acyl-sn-glycerol-3-phosphate acyltransferase [Paenibacillus sp. MER 78]
MIYSICRGLLRFIYTVLFRLEAVGRENIPREGGVVLCCNHISNYDPPTLGIKIERKVRFMAKSELFDIPVLGPVLKAVGAFPVKRGGVSKESIKTALKILRDGQVLGIFPQGSRNNDGGIGKKGAASFALRSGSVVVPAAIIGEYKLFRKMKIVYGKPVNLDEFKDDPSGDALERATEKIMSKIDEMTKTGIPSQP